MNSYRDYESFKKYIDTCMEKDLVKKYLSKDFDLEKLIQEKIINDRKLLQLIINHSRENNSELEKLRQNEQETNDLLYSGNFIWGFTFKDLSKYDLSQVPIEKLLRIPFSTETKWPPKSKLPKGFDPEELIQQAKTFKGLGVERLHSKGITGKGVKVAYIDNKLDLTHEEFVDSKIEQVCIQQNEELNFHGYSVLDRLMGKNVGIAPDVNCTYYACEANGEEHVANVFNALKDVLKRLEAGEEIVAVGLSASIPDYILSATNFGKDKEKFNNLTDRYNKLVKQLNKYGCEIIGSPEFFKKGFNYAFKCDPTKPNDDLDNYVQNLLQNNDTVSVIDAGKLTPLPYTTNGYKYENSVGCASWSIPQVLGLYCLAKQVDRELSFDEFAEIAHATASKPNKHGTKLINAYELVKEVKLRLQDRCEV